MMTRLNTSRMVTGLLMSAVVLTLSGCGELVSGANLKPTVKYKPSTANSAAAETAATAGPPTEVAASEGVGTLRGKVEFTGSFSPLPPLYAKGADVKDAAVCAAVEAPERDDSCQRRRTCECIHLLEEGSESRRRRLQTTSLIFDQKNCMFKPHALTARVGQTIKVLNSDGVAHNTHTYGKKTVQFNSIVPPNDAVGATLIYKQAEQEPISVGCDIHPWMKAYHLPIDHPFVALSGEDGTFEIKDLPAGKHEFKVWHEAGQLLEKSLMVTIKPGDNDLLTIKVSPSQLGK